MRGAGLPALLIHPFHRSLQLRKDAGRAGKSGRARNTETIAIGDRRSVLKGLSNLSLPSKTARIYRPYRGGAGLAAGRPQNRAVDLHVDLLRNDPIAAIGLDKVVCPSLRSS
jgi:hypothetical protein